jgi:uncharacterized protein (TIGR00299 family) protein
MRIAYLDAFSGVSGDMTVGALLDLGVPLAAVQDAIGVLGLAGVETWTERVERSGIAATKFHVRVHGERPDPPGGHRHHHHGHRAYRDIRALLAASRLEPRVRERALAIFARLAEAEGEAHGVAADDVTFHEVGALDAIVDVVGAAVGVTHLGVDRVYCSALPMGGGMVHAAHGPLPVPGPAVAALVRGRPVRFDDGASELVTPTGAAIVATLAATEPVPELRVERVGYGAGDRVLPDRPNLLRIVLGEPATAVGSDEVVVLEATIDDTLPELWEHVLERLFESGAKDAFLEPVVMKKSRPGVTLRVIAAAADRDRLAAVVFAETSTIGLRWAPWRRLVLPRETVHVETEYGTVAVKVATAPNGTRNLAPEFEDCRRLARERGVAAKLVYQAALAAAHRQGR